MRTALRLALLFFMALGLATPAYAAEAGLKGVTVSATGAIKVAPDAATVNFTISTLAKTSAIALDTTNSLQKQARAVALANGSKSDDITTTNISIFPEYQYAADKEPLIIGYRASQSTAVNSYSLTKAAAIIDGLAALSSEIQIGNISLFVSDPSKYEEKARAAAVSKAKAKANSYARLLGRKLGTVQFLTEQSAPVTPIVVSSDFAKAESTLIDAGRQTISVTVEVRWSLR